MIGDACQGESHGKNNSAEDNQDARETIRLGVIDKGEREETYLARAVASLEQVIRTISSRRKFSFLKWIILTRRLFPTSSNSRSISKIVWCPCSYSWESDHGPLCSAQSFFCWPTRLSSLAPLIILLLVSMWSIITFAIIFLWDLLSIRRLLLLKPLTWVQRFLIHINLRTLKQLMIQMNQKFEFARYLKGIMAVGDKKQMILSVLFGHMEVSASSSRILSHYCSNCYLLWL